MFYCVFLVDYLSSRLKLLLASDLQLFQAFGTPLSFDAGEIRVVQLEHRLRRHVLHHGRRVHQLGQVRKGGIVRVHKMIQDCLLTVTPSGIVTIRGGLLTVSL